MKKNSFVKLILRKTIHYLNKLNKNLLIILKRTKIKAALKSKYDNKIVLKFIEYN